MIEALVRDFFVAADSREPQRLLPLLTEDVAWRFANEPTVSGPAAVVDALTGFFGHVIEMKHDIVGIWPAVGCVAVETRVRYRDRFGREFVYPGCDLLVVRDGRFSDVRIFVDNHTMFEPPRAAD